MNLVKSHKLILRRNFLSPETESVMQANIFIAPQLVIFQDNDLCAMPAGSDSQTGTDSALALKQRESTLVDLDRCKSPPKLFCNMIDNKLRRKEHRNQSFAQSLFKYRISPGLSSRDSRKVHYELEMSFKNHFLLFSLVFSCSASHHWPMGGPQSEPLFKHCRDPFKYVITWENIRERSLRVSSLCFLTISNENLDNGTRSYRSVLKRNEILPISVWKFNFEPRTKRAIGRRPVSLKSW